MGLEVKPEPPRLPIGGMLIWLTDTAPNGWLLCYGQEISRSVYARLFVLIGTTFGIGNGTTTFNLPDLRGRLPLGQDDMGGTPANRITNAEADSIGGSAGAENHTLTIAEMPAHTHKLPDAVDGGGFAFMAENLSPRNTYDTSPTGSDNAHNNVQPYLTINYIIKY